MALGRNVKLVRELRGFTQKELSDRTEGKVSQAALSALESRDSKRSVFLKEIAKALCVPTATLLKTNIDLNELQAQPIVAWQDSSPEEEGFVDIPEYELCLSAGNGFENSPDSYFKVQTSAPSVRYRLDFFASRGISPEHCKRFRVSGESMEPLLYDGDRILVNTAPQERIKDGSVYAVRLQKRLDGTLTLISDNPSYPPEIVPPDILRDGRFFIIGKVIEKSSTAGFD